MTLKNYLGLDAFDLLIHIGITGMIMVAAGTAVNGPDDGIFLAIVVAASLGLLGWRRNRALRRMGPDTTEVQLDRMQEIESRLAEVEGEQSRMLELEERLDFAERMLTQQREASRQLGAPRQEA